MTGAPTIPPAVTNLPPDERMLRVARFLAVGLVVLVSLRLAWVGDDALITLRTALNITHGWGPGFNATESVQAFTHPLWFLMWVSIGAVTNQWILGILAASLAFTAIAVGLLTWRTRSIARLIFVVALLLMSNAFIEYSTSGLENPMAYAGLGVLLAMTVGVSGKSRIRPSTTAALFGLSLAAVVLTRFDLTLLILPIAALAAYNRRKCRRLLVIGTTAAIVPLLLWMLWSYLTYSSFLPNTFAAKRNVEIPAHELMIQGIRYLWVTFEHDPASLIAIVIGLAAAIALGTNTARAWAAGVILYSAYVVWIGGDFMAGRFFAVPVYVCVFLLATVRLSPESESAAIWRPNAVAASVAASVLVLVGSAYAGSVPVGLSNAQVPRWEFDWNLNGGIADERAVWVGGSSRGLSNIMNNLALAYTQPDFAWPSTSGSKSRSLREIDKAAKNWPVGLDYIGLPSDTAVLCGGLGTNGIVSGPYVHLIDDCGLTDRFLAEKPFIARDFQWRVGDYHRALPEGYLEAIQQGRPDLVKDQLDQFRLKELWARIRPSSD
jgi:arabinofuranosyltransferase